MRKALYLLGILEDTDVQWLAAHGTRQFVPARTVLIEEGRDIDHLYVLLNGELSVIVKSAPGKEIARLYSGEIVGEISFIDARPPTASVTAARDCQVLAIPRDVLKKHFAADGGFAARFYQAIATFLADRLRMTVGRLGYGSFDAAAEADEIADDFLVKVDLAAVRFDSLLRQLEVN